MVKRGYIFPVFFMAFSLGIPTAKAQSRPADPQQRKLSLNLVLSCANDPFVRTIFETDWSTAVELNAVLMRLPKTTEEKSNWHIAELRMKGFTTTSIDDSTMSILPNKQRTTGASKQEAFCRNYYKVHFSTDDKKPLLIEVGAEDWVLDANEIFAHADQFHFESGVFSDSSEPFLIASKGSVSIQFVGGAKRLRLHRVMYSRQN